MAHKAAEGVFPARSVLSMLQRNERLRDQSSPTPTEHHENQHFNRQREEIVSESPPSQLEEATEEKDATKEELPKILLCPLCRKSFSSEMSLRAHLTDDDVCNQTHPDILPNDGGKPEPKACFKCGKTFASWQGLRGHLNRVKPCDQEKLAATTTARRRPAASKTCNKCGKTFSSQQSLRIHMNRVKPCDQEKNGVSTPTTPPATQPTKTLLMETEEIQKELERKVKARYQARKAYLKKRGRLDELKTPRSELSESDKGPEETVTNPDVKRRTPDESSLEDKILEASNVESKRQRIHEVASQEDLSIDSPSDVSGLNNTQPSLTSEVPAPPSSVPPQKTTPSQGSFVRRSSKGHGGDLLAGGCNCPPCVRRWARKLMNRMQQLEDEVLTLRKQNVSEAENGASNVTGAGSTELPALQVNAIEVSRSQAVGVGNSLFTASNSDMLRAKSVGVTSVNPTEVFRSLVDSSNGQPLRREFGSANPSVFPSQGGQPFQNESRLGDLLRVGEVRQQTSTAAVKQNAGSDKRSLMDAYSHMNDQILLNERMVEDSSGHAILAGYNAETAMDFRKQLDELRASIATEKSKREITAANLIAHEWQPRRDEFMALLESEGDTNSSSEEQAHHAKWSELSDQLSGKDKVISELERRMDSLGENGGTSRTRYAEMGELSSKMAAEYSIKMALESDRERIYLGLVKSSTRIRSLVRNALL